MRKIIDIYKFYAIYFFTLSPEGWPLGLGGVNLIADIDGKMFDSLDFDTWERESCPLKICNCLWPLLSAHTVAILDLTCMFLLLEITIPCLGRLLPGFLTVGADVASFFFCVVFSFKNFFFFFYHLDLSQDLSPRNLPWKTQIQRKYSFLSIELQTPFPQDLTGKL